jgi:hypothetical protein
MRALIEEKQHAFDEIVRALISKRDATAWPAYGNQLFSAWHEGGIPFAISRKASSRLSNSRPCCYKPGIRRIPVELGFSQQQHRGGSVPDSADFIVQESPHERKPGEQQSGHDSITTNPVRQSRHAPQKKISTSEMFHFGAPDIVICFLAVAPEFSNFRMAVEGAPTVFFFQIRSK